MKHTKIYVEGTEKQYRKDPHSYLLNECWKDEIILDPEVIEEQKLKQIEIKREEKYKEQIEKQRKIDEDSADDDWRKEFLSSVSNNLKKKK